MLRGFYLLRLALTLTVALAAAGWALDAQARHGGFHGGGGFHSGGFHGGGFHGGCCFFSFGFGGWPFYAPSYAYYPPYPYYPPAYPYYYPPAAYPYPAYPAPGGPTIQGAPPAAHGPAAY